MNRRLLLSRRRFLGSAGAAAAALGVATASSHGNSFWIWRHQNRSFRLRGNPGLGRLLARRRNWVYHAREEAARAEYRAGVTLPTPNTDEETFSSYIGSFTKTLPHNELGEVDPAAYGQLTEALRTGEPGDFENIPLSPGASARLANPQAALAYTFQGGDSHRFTMPAAPAFSSAWEASEMGEVYLHAVLRDVAFDDFGTSPAVDRAVAQMNEFSDFRGPKEGGVVTAGTLFRGETAGDLIGNYISQFLLLPISESGTTREQLYPTPIQGFDHMVRYSDWLNILRGGAPTTANTFEAKPRYIATGRDLANFVHTDYSYQAYLQAALILAGRGTASQPNNPYLSLSKQGAFVTFGGAEILTTIANVALIGLKAAWYQKWSVHRRLRPEVFSGRIHNNKIGSTSYPISREIMDSSILDDVFAQNDLMTSGEGTYLLPMSYPEGSPTHPAYPAGHAVIAGACVTVLKAFFDESEILSEAVEVTPGSDGSEIRAYTGGEVLTVGNELNKLANNISLGRDIAGVHWRTDGTEGMLLGEQVAISYLKEQKETYNEGRFDLQFTGFNGNLITV